MKKIVIFGCGGHAISVYDSIKKNNKYEIAGFVDKTVNDFSYGGYGIIATDNTLETLKEKKINIGVLGIGSVYGGNIVRSKIFHNARKLGISFPMIKDVSATVADLVSIEEGTFVGKGVIINSNVEIGKCCIINTGSIIEHSAKIGDFTHVSAGSVVCGDVIIGENCFIGANSTVIQGIKIGDNVTIGAGAVVIKDVKDGETVVGNPAKSIGKKYE